MKKSILKWAAFLSVGLIVGLYTAYVAECFWNWFAVPTLHVDDVSFFQMLGLLWLVQLIIKPFAGDDIQQNKLISVVGLCVPEDKQAEVAEITRTDDTSENVMIVFAQVGRNTVMLILGFVLHMFV
jgi:hypothetical protein